MGAEFGRVISRQSEVLLELRENASDGRLTRVLRRLPLGLRQAVEENHKGIKASVHLIRELKAHVAMLDALRGTLPDPQSLDDLAGLKPSIKASAEGHRTAVDPASQQLLDKLSWRSLKRRPHSPVCPLARYLRALALQEAVAPFAFDEIRQELAMVTVIAGYAPDLLALETLIAQTQARMKTVSQGMSKRGRGFFALGHCEADLRSLQGIQNGAELREIARGLNWEIHDCGGWVLSLHALVRCSDHRLLRGMLLDEFPLGGPRRIKIQPLKPWKSVAENIEVITRYMLKQDQHVDQIRGLIAGSHLLPGDGAVEELFLGPNLDVRVPGCFDLSHTLRQYALFLDRMGFDGMEVNVVNHFVHGWWNAEEYQWFLRNHEFEQLHGYSTAETFRSRPTKRDKNGRRRNLPYPGFRRFPTGLKRFG